MTSFSRAVAELKRYPSAVAGLLLIALLLLAGIFAPLYIPYGEALAKWRGGDAWRMYPVNAAPAWTDWLTGNNNPRTQILSTRDASRTQAHFAGGRQEHIALHFDYEADGFPSELNVFLQTDRSARAPFVRLTWLTPSGERFLLGGQRVSAADRISISQHQLLSQRLGQAPHVGLFAQPASRKSGATPVVQKGRYTLAIDAILFGDEATLEADLVVYGRVHGIAGTDHQRRDLLVALLWGIPIALAFGLLAAVGTTLTTLFIAAAGVWYGGWRDALIQRLTEINMILPLLPILVMIGALYSTSIWLMLGVVVLLSIFGGGIKMYRAMLLPIKQAPYIEAARAYGAGGFRIVIRYMIPRVLPVLIPTFVTLIPTFVFLEASLAVLGLGDPVLPTWGKILNDAQTQSALYNGYYYWVLAPAVLLMLTGLGFAMLGFAMDRVFNPRLRSL
ncbi:MAG: ABC transporter permease [Proteobacteria bacterium]|nr:ABC transporter permease [Pseudomonadota bacterium]